MNGLSSAMNLRVESPKRRGLVEVVSPETSELSLLTFSMMLMGPDETIVLGSGNEERALLLMEGICDVEISGRWFKGLRRLNVFAEKATALYVPAGATCTVISLADTEVASVSAPAEVKFDSYLVRPEDVGVRKVGRDNWYREVHDIIHAGTKAQRLLVGETLNPPGNWSSFPPHRHERDMQPGESKLEELYHFRLDPPSGFGLQRVYTDDGEVDEVILVRDRDTVLIPRGYHPVVSAPGYTLYYLWALAGESRELLVHEDPSHSWVSER